MFRREKWFGFKISLVLCEKWSQLHLITVIVVLMEAQKSKAEGRELVKTPQLHKLITAYKLPPKG